MVEQFFANGEKAVERGTALRLAIERRADGEFIGWCTFNSWNPDFRSASIGYALARAEWGKGFATEAAAALLDWAYAALDLNRVQAEADTRNIASRRVLEKLGFLLEGTLREDCVVDGVVSDSWIFGLLRRDRDVDHACGDH
ncbi:GNAT family N-acetyltransferase [Microbacterium sp. KR10-403]|uniref:GNAT family N-acetyltransferase n=1 Tax=Microbacterium sp. KR10-403 TaxID=3158581 RepID=UPI0032E48A53